MCMGCRVERLERYDGNLDEIRKRVENYKRQQPTGTNLIAKDRETLLDLLDQAEDKGRREAVPLLRRASRALVVASLDQHTEESAAESFDTSTAIDKWVAGLKESEDSSNASESPTTPDYIIEVVGNGDGTMNVLTESGMRWRLTEDEYRAWPHRDASESPRWQATKDKHTQMADALRDASESPPTDHHWDCRIPQGRTCLRYGEGGNCVCWCHDPLGDASESGQPPEASDE